MFGCSLGSELKALKLLEPTFTLTSRRTIQPGLQIKATQISTFPIFLLERRIFSNYTMSDLASHHHSTQLTNKSNPTQHFFQHFLLILLSRMCGFYRRRHHVHVHVYFIIIIVFHRGRCLTTRNGFAATSFLTLVEFLNGIVQ